MSTINETHPYKAAYGHDIGRDIGHDMSCPYVIYAIWRSKHLIGHDMSCPYVTYAIWRSKHLSKLAACST